MRLSTKLIHHPGAYCEQTGAVSTPIYQASTFKQDAVGKNRGYDYSRTGNPTRAVLEAYIAELESGTHGVAFASGMAATSSCLMLLRSGDHLIATQGLYGGSYRVLTRVFQDFDVGCSFVDTSDMAAVRNAFRAETRAVFIETPSNPLMVISDIAALAGLAHEKGAIVMVDNTFMSPLLQRPLELGVDIVVHSATKFLGGHSDLVAGLAATKDESLAKRLKRIQNAVGAVPSPFDCWLLIRGMKTLGVRLGRSQENAQQIAGWLAGRPEVARVLYPGVEGLPGFDVHQRQADGPGAVLSFIVSEGLSAEAIVNSVSVWTLAVSLGAVESLIALPTKMTHLSYPREELNRLGLGDNLIRLSVGIEDPEDLIADLEDAFRTAKKAS